MTREEIKQRLLAIQRSIDIRTEEDKRDFMALEIAIMYIDNQPKNFWYGVPEMWNRNETKGE